MTKQESHNEPEGTEYAQSGGKNPLPWIAGAVLLLGLAVIGGFYWSSNMKVKKLRFEGNHFVSKADLQMVEVPMNVNPDSIDFGDIINRFERIPYVKQANISVQPSGNLVVSISERKPVALLADGNRKIYVDRQGVRLPLVLGKAVDVPILYGFRAGPMEDTLQTDGFKRSSDFLTSVQNRPVSNATISEVTWTRDEGVVALTNQNGVKLIFGKGDYDTRLRNWEAFYGKVIKNKGIETMRSVDLRFKGQIVTREKEI